ncbi:MAG: hypothetical protein KJO07_24340 [Deltaproteobacteria bacterium]|nr:hypothetical protein [Deltaproteobacteria bacterium]
MVRAAVAVLALVGLGAGLAAAQSGDALVPEDWVPLPRLAAAVPASGVVKTRQAHGDPSRGVYLFVQEIELARGIETSALAQEVGKALATKGFELRGQGPQGGQFSLGKTTGGFRIKPGQQGHARVVTCFYNERDLERSKKACADALERSEKTP